MKSDLITSIGVAILGTVISYFVCNMFIGEIEPKSIKTIDGSVSASLATPDPEVFNYRALNPTVETYVGECTQVSENGECLDEDSPTYTSDSDLENEQATEENADEEGNGNTNASINGEVPDVVNPEDEASNNDSENQ